MDWSTKAQEMQIDLRRAGYFLDPAHALMVASFWETRRQPLLCQGEPGTGKTEIALALARARGVKDLRFLPCYDGIGPAQALYSFDKTLQEIELEFARLAGPLPADIRPVIYNERTLIPGVLMQTLLDDDEHASCLIDEIDKVPRQGEFSAMLLRFLETGTITVIETQQLIKPKSGKRPHIFITSNASDDIPLTGPLRRRSKFLRFRRPTAERMYEILCEVTPGLADLVRWDVAQFIFFSNKAELDKPIALSEAIDWAITLEWGKVQELDRDVITETIGDLAKGDFEAERLIQALNRILIFVRNQRAFYEGFTLRRFGATRLDQFAQDDRGDEEDGREVKEIHPAESMRGLPK